MAFYTGRLDGTGNGTDRPRISRNHDIRRFSGSCSARQSANNNGVLVRYINPAALVEKTQEPDTCDESLSGIVPPLDLNSSGETLPSEAGNEITFAIQKPCEISRITKSDAFSNWLSAKRKLKSYELARQKEIENEKKRLQEEKKALAQQKYKEWLRKKVESKEKQNPAERQMQEYQVYHSNDDDNESNRRAWELNKQEELRRKKLEQLRASEQKRLLEEKRKEEAARAWENWLAEAPLKPKPVPLNQGFLTLKGTVSDIFVNPNPWRDPCVVTEGD